MTFDSIPLDRMSPDSSAYRKGLRVATNCVPDGNGAWRELTVPTGLSNETLPATGTNAGSFADPAGPVFVGTTHPGVPSARLYEVDPTTGAFTNRTPGTNYAGAPARWSFTKFGPSVIAAPHNNGTGAAIQLQVRSGSGNFADLVTSPDRPAPKYLCTCKSYVVGAYNLAAGGAGLYASENRYQVMWCSRNNAAVWTPGTDRAGFAPDLADALGEITGLVGFKDFFLVFQEYGVTRFSWVGGDAVWDPQEIAAHAYGVSAAWSPSLVGADRDVYYIANIGPARVLNGEAVESIDGDVRRYFMDRSGGNESTDRPLARSQVITGCMDPWSRVIVWGGKHINATAVQFMLGLDDLRFAVTEIDAQVSGSDHCSVRDAPPIYPLENIVTFRMNIAGGLNPIRFAQTTRTTLTMKLTTARWRPTVGQRVRLQAVRPIVLFNGPAPMMRLFITHAMKPNFADAVTREINDSSIDSNGWLTSSIFPLEGAEFVFELWIPDMGDATTIDEVASLELAFEGSSVF